MAVANSSLFTLHSSLYFFAAQKYKKILTYRKKRVTLTLSKLLHHGNTNKKRFLFVFLII